ncbi:MAG: patatin-like phospholipase family protein [Fimbriiglobus sp.]
MPTDRRCAPPCPESRGTTNDAPPSDYKFTDPDTFDKLTESLAKGGEPAPNRKNYEILAVSGGGKYGAYPAGVVCGWTAAGNRPVFDIATGVSTGAYVAVFGFLGPKYDEALKKFYTTTTKEMILKNNPYVTLPWASSFASSEPLKNLITETITPEILTDLAQAHAEGRRLFIGTTNLDTKRLCVWDVTTIAASNRPDKKELIRDIFLATASVPGEFPPVPFKIKVNGEEFTELHVDGGVTSEVFARLAILNVPQEQLLSGPRPLTGSNIHIILAGKLFADPSCTKPKLIGILGSSVSSLIYAMTQNDILRIGYLCNITGMKSRFSAIPRDFEDDGDALNFEPIGMTKLFNLGFEAARSGQAWRTRAPGIEPSEQSVPRTGTDFTIPNLPAPGQYGGPVLPRK